MARTPPPGYLQRRGAGFRVRLCAGGQRFSFTVRTDDRRVAEDFARQKQAELERQVDRQRRGFPGPLPMSAILDEFERDELPTKSPGCRRSYADSLKPLRLYFVGELGDPTVDQVRAGHVEAFLTWRRGHRIASRPGPDDATIVDAVAGRTHPRTIAKDRALLHAVLAMADRREYVAGNAVARTAAPKADARAPVLLTDEQFEKLLEACDDPLLRLYVLLLNETGARCESEALWVRWDDVDLDGGFLWIASGRDGHRTKSGKGRWVPLTPSLRDALRAHFARFRFASYAGQPTPWLFHHDHSRRHYRAGDRIKSLRDGVMAAAKVAKAPAGWHLHDLRHRRVTTWLAEGRNAVHVREAVGHSDLRTTMSYTHLAREHLRALVDARPTQSGVAALA